MAQIFLSVIFSKSNYSLCPPLKSLLYVRSSGCVFVMLYFMISWILSPTAKPVLFKNSLQNVEREAGDIAILRCETTKPGASVVWRHGDTVLESSSKYQLKQEGTSVQLIIYKLQGADSGEYSCDTGSQRTSAVLSVQGRLLFLVLSLESCHSVCPSSLHLGDCLFTKKPLSLMCISFLSGDPVWDLPHFHISTKIFIPWVLLFLYTFKKHVTFVFSVTTVSSCAPVFVYTYKTTKICTWVRVPSLDTTPVLITHVLHNFLPLFVKHLSQIWTVLLNCIRFTEVEISIVKYLESCVVYEGEDVHFQCLISHEDAPLAQWKLEGVPLQNNEMNLIKTNGRSHSLTLRSVTAADSGTVTFSVGNHMSTASLTVKGKVDI